jgi:hypothetical protein
MTVAWRSLLGALAVAALFAQQREPGAVQPDPAFAPVEDVAGLPRVLLVGDSISIGYTPFVRELLKGKVNVHRIPDNASATINGLAHIDEWLGNGKWDVIHFNWGLHDLKIMEDRRRQVEEEVYTRNLETLIERMKKTGAALIFATTTPVPEGPVNPPRISTDVILYNNAARGVMERSGVRINDLYAAVSPRLKELQLRINVHYTPEGYRFLAEKVAAEIKAVLKIQD